MMCLDSKLQVALQLIVYMVDTHQVVVGSRD